MLFNSPEFIFLFLPVAVVLHFIMASRSQTAAIITTTISSLVFYAWWNPPFVLMLVASIALNFWLARVMVASEPSTARVLMLTGIAANLLVLCYFKYADFLLSIFDGHTALPPNVPLALSFTTFVQIAFLVAMHKRRSVVDFRHYALFVSFFPHLIAGPIVRWNSLGPQIANAARYRLNWDNVATGLTIFTLGLVKKVLIADSLGPHVGQVFDTVARGEPVTAAAAWGSCFAFASQIYFDFSGYSDMAVGLGLLFNYRLPINFAAPLRATNIFDLWRRWHMTLSRWFRDFVYVPMGVGRDLGPLGRSFNLIVTMVLAGLWHGASWTFVAWGAFHGVALLINQAWRMIFGVGRPTRIGAFFGWALTFTIFAAGAVFFRAADIATSWHLIVTMAGFGDATIPAHLTMDWDAWGIKNGYFSEAFILSVFGTHWTMVGTLLTIATLGVALLLPDTMELVGYKEGEGQSDWRRSVGLAKWQPSWAWLGVSIVLFVAVFFRIGQVSEFFYYQF